LWPDLWIKLWSETKLERYLSELDEQFGEVPEELVERFDAEWPS
jgi:hypothetical protein